MNAQKKEGKLRPKWEGPYKIEKMLGTNTYVLQTLQSEALGKTWNTMHLKKYFLAVPITRAVMRKDKEDEGSCAPQEALLDHVMDWDSF